MVKNPVMLTAVGAAAGIAQTFVTKNNIDAIAPPIPYVSNTLGAWGQYSTFANIVIGGIATGLSATNKVIKQDSARNFLIGYGVTTLLGGILNGVYASGAGSGSIPFRMGAQPFTHVRGQVSGGVRAGTHQPNERIYASYMDADNYRPTNDNGFPYNSSDIQGNNDKSYPGRYTGPNPMVLF